MQEFILVAVCYRGFFSTQLKTIVFSQDNELLIISSETGTVHVYAIGDAMRNQRTLKDVRKKELQSCVHLKSDFLAKQLFEQSLISKPMLKKMVGQEIAK